jgi:hypothetical protein
MPVIFEGTSEIQRMLIGRAGRPLGLTCGFTEATRRRRAVLFPKWGPFSCPYYLNRAGYFPSFPDPMLNSCYYLRGYGLDQS